MSRYIKAFVFSLLLLLVFIACNNRKEKNAKEENSSGVKLYNSLCTSCHGLKGNLKLSGAADLQVSKLSLEGIAETISNGKGTMPSFKKYLSEEQIVELSEYCLSLRK